MGAKGLDEPIAAVYTERNQAVAVLVKLAYRLGYDAWVDSSDPEWPIVFVDLPQGGQVSWHIPAAEFRAFFQTGLSLHTTTKMWQWDGHDHDEKARRLIREAKGT